MIRAIIIDDEKNAQRVLSLLVKANCPEIEVLTHCSSGTEGLEQIAKLKPDLIFLDIQMRDMSGFDMLEKMDEINFEIIFTTAFDQYALDAFKVSAVDYLMKPIDEIDLQKAVNKAKKHFENKRTNRQVSFLLDHLRNNAETSEKIIALPSQTGLEFIELEDIIYCQSDSNYTHFVFTSDKKMIVSKTLKDIEALLPRQSFFRVHNSYIVNLKYIRRYLKADGGYLIMSNDDKVKVSRAKKEGLLERF